MLLLNLHANEIHASLYVIWQTFAHACLLLASDLMLDLLVVVTLGPCATNHFHTGGFIRTSSAVKHPDWQMHFMPACVEGQLDILERHGYQVQDLG